MSGENSYQKAIKKAQQTNENSPLEDDLHTVNSNIH